VEVECNNDGFSTSWLGDIVLNFMPARGWQRQLMPSLIQTRWIDIQTKTFRILQLFGFISNTEC
jgi:hypothetical protein